MSDLALLSPPRISVAQVARVLTRATAPPAAIAEAAAIHAAIAAHGLDPAVGLAFAQKEHSLRWLGVAQHTKGLANVTTAALACVGARSRRSGSYNRFASYRTYADGAWDWAAYMRCRYLDRGILDLDDILAIYAPVSDGNDPAAYAQRVRELVAAWAEEDRRMQPAPADPWASWGDAFPLPEEQRAWAIPQAWRRARDLGAATSPEIYVDARPGRAISIQTFATGWIVYEQANGATSVSRRTA